MNELTVTKEMFADMVTINQNMVEQFRRKRISFSELVDSQLDDDTRKIVSDSIGHRGEFSIGQYIGRTTSCAANIYSLNSAATNLESVQQFIADAQRQIAIAQALEKYYAKVFAAIRKLESRPVFFLIRKKDYYGSKKVTYRIYEGTYHVDRDHYEIGKPLEEFEGTKRNEAIRMLRQHTESTPTARGFMINHGLDHYNAPDYAKPLCASKL